MDELIPISEHNGKRAVNARHLHSFLESKREFATWIKDRISKYGFIENQDYAVFDEFVKNPSGGRPLTEYALSVSCAKEISMVEGNSKGKQARQYFIACEEKFKAVSKSLTSTEMSRLNAQLTAEQGKRISKIENKLQEINSLTALAQQFPDITINVKAGELLEMANHCVLTARKELEQHVIDEKTEKFFTAEQTAATLGTTKVTLWRWEKIGYLVPRRIGCMIRYSSFDVQRILKGG